jgi:hypothetical protein
MRIITPILALLFLIASCANFNIDRLPASAIAITDNDVAKVFEFEKSNLISKTNYKDAIMDLINKNKLFAGNAFQSVGNEISVEFIEDTTLPPNIAYFPELEVKNNQYKITILHAKDAIFDPAASEELYAFIGHLRNFKYVVNHFASFEMYFNAQAKDPNALLNLAKIRSSSGDNAYNLKIPEQQENLVNEVKKRHEHWDNEKTKYELFVKQEAKIQKEKDAERRAVIDALDKASEDQQFKTLIANNDRKGVSKLLKQYLPWEQMAPFEKKFWENHLNIIENPLPLDQRILVYRGIDDDVIYAANEGGQALEKESAQKDGKVFLMSTMMTKNQGTWNRRLRSLTAMNEKFIATNDNGSSEYTKSARVTTMFFNHSREPKGSPFLSLTPSFEVAQRFGSKKMSAYLLDPREMSYNFASKYKNEIEFLMPLMVFPDEVVYFYDSSIHTGTENTESSIKSALQLKMIRTYGENEGEVMNRKILQNSKDYFDSAVNRYAGKKSANVNPTEPNIVVKFFSGLFIKKPVEEEAHIAKPVNMSCMDLISQFWK